MNPMKKFSCVTITMIACAAVSPKVLAQPRFGLFLPQAPLPAVNPNGSVHFVTMGDSRQSPGNLHDQVWHDIASLAASEQPQFSIFTGDMTAFSPSRILWRNFFNQGKPLIDAAPMYPVWGNHELATRIPDRRFDFPGDNLFSRVRNGFGNYSFDVGPVNIAVVNTDPTFRVAEGRADARLGEGSRTYRFLENDLANTDEPWKIVFLHRPPYSAGEHGPQGDVQALTPLFDRYGVDVVFGGHDHGFQRSKPIYNDEVAPAGQGTTYIVSAGAGARLYDIDTDHNAGWLANAVKDYNYSIVDANSNTMTITTKNRDGQIIDAMTMTKATTQPSNARGFSGSYQ
jgi:predicted MPP superfamily phosphohydrolase